MFLYIHLLIIGNFFNNIRNNICQSNKLICRNSVRWNYKISIIYYKYIYKTLDGNICIEYMYIAYILYRIYYNVNVYK